MENNAALKSNKPLIDAYAEVNEGLSLALNTLLVPIEKDGTNSGVLNVVDFVKANPYSVLYPPGETKTHAADFESPSGAGNYLISYQSVEDTTKLINAYDPVDISLKGGNLDPGFDSSLGCAPGFLQNLEADC
jgi:hypothetical protein